MGGPLVSFPSVISLTSSSPDEEDGLLLLSEEDSFLFRGTFCFTSLLFAPKFPFSATFILVIRYISCLLFLLLFRHPSSLDSSSGLHYILRLTFLPMPTSLTLATLSSTHPVKLSQAFSNPLT